MAMGNERSATSCGADRVASIDTMELMGIASAVSAWTMLHAFQPSAPGPEPGSSTAPPGGGAGGCCSLRGSHLLY